MADNQGRHRAQRTPSDRELLSAAVRACEADPTLPRPSAPGVIDTLRIALRRDGSTYSGLVTTARYAWQASHRRPYYSEVDIEHDVLTLPTYATRPGRRELVLDLADLLVLLIGPRDGVLDAVELSVKLDMDPLPGL